VARPEPSLLVDVDDLGRRETGVPQRQVDRVVPLAAGQHPDRRTPDEAARDVPARPSEQLVPPGGDAGEVGRRRTGGEPDLTVLRQAEQVDQPRARHLLHGRHARRHLTHRGVLVPRRDEPVRCQGGGVGATDHEAEEPPRRHRGQPRLDRGAEQVHDVRRRGRLLGELAAEGVRDGRRVVLCRHRPTGQAAAPLGRAAVRPLQGSGEVLVDVVAHHDSLGPDRSGGHALE
jgi:hypothetical protein